VGEDVVPLGLNGSRHIVVAENQGIHDLPLLRPVRSARSFLGLKLTLNGLEHGGVGVPDEESEELVLRQPQGLGGPQEVVPTIRRLAGEVGADDGGGGLALEQELEAPLKAGTMHAALVRGMDLGRHDCS
jgi:hypothetical protein